MGTIHFIITYNTHEYVFNKSNFKYMNTTFSSGTTGVVDLYFDGKNTSEDKITITIDKFRMGHFTREFSKKLAVPGYAVVKIETTGLYKSIKTITYTAGS